MKPDADGFFTIDMADIPHPDQMTLIQINGQGVILTCWQGEWHAFSEVCPHAAASLAEGDLYKGKVTCPDHDYKFDIGTGRTLWPEDEVCRLKKYPVKVEDQQLKVRVS